MFKKSRRGHSALKKEYVSGLFRLAKPTEIDGLQVTRVFVGTVVVRGPCYVYGNQIKALRLLEDVFLGLLADEMDRWWFISIDPGNTIRLIFTGPGYVCPLDGQIVSGADLPVDNSGAAQVDVGASHPFAVWAEYDRPSPSVDPSQVPSRWKPVVGGARLSLPQTNPVSTTNNPFAVVTKLATNQATNQFAAAIQVIGALTPGEGIEVNGVYTPPEHSSAFGTAMKRDALFVYCYIECGAGGRGNVFYVGDVSMYTEYRIPYSFRIVFGQGLTNRPAATGSFILGIWCPYDEEGLSAILKAPMRMELRIISPPQYDVPLPSRLSGGPTAGRAVAGLQGTQSKRTDEGV